MRADQRIVTRLPLDELWDEQGTVPARNVGALGRAEITELLRLGRVAFVVADVGLRLMWIPLEECYGFWKAEVRPRLVEPRVQNFVLEDFPGEYCYLASEWRVAQGDRVVVLEKCH